MANAPQGAAPEPRQDVSVLIPLKKKRLLRHYLLDKTLQLRYVAFVAVLSAVIAGALGALVWWQAHDASRTIIDSLNSPDMDWLGPSMKAEISERLTTSDTTLVLIMAGTGLALMAILVMYLLLMTHKVAGPLFKIGQYFDQIRAGKLGALVELRKGDQLQDFFERFRVMHEALRQRTKDEAALFGRFLDACDAAGVMPVGDLSHRLDELRALKKKKEAAIQ